MCVRARKSTCAPGVVFHDLALEAMQHHFCCVPLAETGTKFYLGSKEEKQTTSWCGSGKVLQEHLGSFCKTQSDIYSNVGVTDLSSEADCGH